MEDEKLEETEATTKSRRQQKCLWNGKHRLNAKNDANDLHRRNVHLKCEFLQKISYVEPFSDIMFIFHTYVKSTKTQICFVIMLLFSKVQ